MEQSKKLSDALAKAAQKYDTKLGSMNAVVSGIEAISCGNIALDFLTGVDGFPLGRSIELFGPPSCGKTTLALLLAAEAQRTGRNVLYMDFEHAMDKIYAAKLGVDVDSVIFAQPDTFEQGGNIVRDLLETGEIGVVIHDSVAAMTPAALIEAETGKVVVALQARMMADYMRQLNPLLKESGCMGIFLNHVSDMIGGFQRPGMPAKRTTPGGKALKYYASVRIEFRRIGEVYEDGISELTLEKSRMARASNVKAQCIKNKVGPPFREAVLRTEFGKGFSRGYSLAAILMGHKKIKKQAGGIFLMADDRLVHADMLTNGTGGKYVRGESNLVEFLDKRPMLLAQWERVASELLAEAPDVPADNPDYIEVRSLPELMAGGEMDEAEAAMLGLTEDPNSFDLSSFAVIVE